MVDNISLLENENYLAKCRFEQNNMTRQELADLVGVREQTIQLIESNKSLPSILLAMKIAKVFGKDVDEIFILKGDKS